MYLFSFVNISNINIVAQNIATIQQKVNLSGDNAVFNNLSATAKQNIALLGIPNYSSAVSISTGAVASTNGLVFALNIPLQKIGSVTTHTTAELYVNGFLAGKAYGADTIQDATSMYAIVKVGDVITFTNMAAVYFIPFY